MLEKQRYVFTEWQPFFFSLLRMAIGWHFLREGVIKLANPTWTAAGYLAGSWGPFASIFNEIGTAMIGFVNVAIPLSLTIAGAGLLLGLFTRLSGLIAAGLLLTFYLATPPFDFGPATLDWAPFRSGVEHALWAGKHAINTEGNYLVVNKNLIELFAVLAIMTIPPSIMWGLDAVVSPTLSKMFGLNKA